jgi:hypothetical protein
VGTARKRWERCGPLPPDLKTTSEEKIQMATPKLTDLRHFEDLYGVQWRVFGTGKVERYSADLRDWVESNYRLDQLVDNPEISEVTSVVDGAA